MNLSRKAQNSKSLPQFLHIADARQLPELLDDHVVGLLLLHADRTTDADTAAVHLLLFRDLQIPQGHPVLPRVAQQMADALDVVQLRVQRHHRGFPVDHGVHGMEHLDGDQDRQKAHDRAAVEPAAHRQPQRGRRAGPDALSVLRQGHCRVLQ